MVSGGQAALNLVLTDKLIDTNRKVMTAVAYLYKRVRTKHRDFVSRTKVLSYTIKGSKRKRGVRCCKTSESRAERNKRNAILKHKFRMYNNFDVNDWWITLTNLVNRDPLEAHKLLMYELNKISKRLKRKGIPFVYYVKTEASDTQRVHHHLLIKNTCPGIAEMIVEAWLKYGRVSDQRKIYDLSNGKLISYILNGGNHKDLNFEKYSHSRNMTEPEVETRLYPADSFRERPKPPPDEYITEKKKEYKVRYEIENLYNGFPDIDGYIYQYYELTKIKEELIE